MIRHIICKKCIQKSTETTDKNEIVQENSIHHSLDKEMKALEQKKSNFVVGFPIGAVFFGSLVGPSMVSGIYSKVYLAPYGAWAFVFALFFQLFRVLLLGSPPGSFAGKKYMITILSVISYMAAIPESAHR